MGKAAHLIIDMQKHFLKVIKQEESQRLCAAIDKFAAKTAKDIHHIYVQSVAESDWFDTPEERDSKVLAIPLRPSLSDLANASFYKKGSSAMKIDRLIETDLPCRLGNLGIDTVYLSGIYHSLCVWQTALDARDLGFNVYILEDMTGENPGIATGKADRKNFPRITSDIAASHGIAFVKSDSLLSELKQEKTVKEENKGAPVAFRRVP